MWNFIKKYRAFLLGAGVTWLIVELLSYKNLILIDASNTPINLLIFLFYCFLISVSIHKFQHTKSNFPSIHIVIGVAFIILITLLISSGNNTPDNPLMILLFTIIYLTTAFLTAPKFFKKYQIGILSYYSTTYCVFFYFRVLLDNSALYGYLSLGIFISFIVPIPILLSLWSYEQWKWFQVLKVEKASAELSMLQAQINPHFFFNTLNNLYALTLKKSDQAPEVILKLSDMMRYTIYEGKKEVVEIKEEINYLTNYIELHKIRNSKNIEVSFKHNVSEHSKVAPLLFIIPLENAFKHGIMSISDEGFISIDLEQKESSFYFEIKNNFDPENKTKTKGIGLENIKRRLDLLYKDSYELKTSISNNNTYTFILKIPAHA